MTVQNLWLFCGRIVNAQGKPENDMWPTFGNFEEAKVWCKGHYINLLGKYEEEL